MNKKPFLFGTATSAYQLEGGINNTDWNTFENEGKVKGQDQSGKSADHYNRYEEDFDIAQSLGVNAHRLSIEWARIEPYEGIFDHKEIEHYKEVLQSLKKRKLTIFLTLHHFTNPIWFAKKGGWENKKAPDYFLRYSKKIIDELGEYVDYWLPINEPNILMWNGYIMGYWPPEKSDLVGAIKAFGNLVKGHKKIYSYIKSKNPEAQVGISLAVMCLQANKKNPLDILTTSFHRLIRNKIFANLTKGSFDFIGVQYYMRQKIQFIPWPPFVRHVPAHTKHTDTGWEIYPEGIYFLLKELSSFGKPLYVTENGIADRDDDLRSAFITDHIKHVKRAYDEGVDVRGYLYWSLLDNFEWRDGFDMRFGLVEVDFKTLKRTIRKSALVFRDIIQEGI